MHSASMSADADRNAATGMTTTWSRTHQPSVKCFRLSQLRKLRGCEQVAAVCYRVRGSGIEFLLVRTNSGHWTFPKGNAEPGLTHAQAAALEAYEEAGVHGRMEEASFTTYVRRKRADMRSATRATERSPEKELAIQAHLCEVSRLDPPQERNRNPTWFSVEKAKRRLREDRTADFGAEVARVVDRAVIRIGRLRRKISTHEPPRDSSQKAQFIEAIRRTSGLAKASRTS